MLSSGMLRPLIRLKILFTFHQTELFFSSFLPSVFDVETTSLLQISDVICHVLFLTSLTLETEGFLTPYVLTIAYVCNV